MKSGPAYATPAAAQQPRDADLSALGSWRCHLVLWLVAAVGLTADLWSKAWAFSTLDPREHMTVWSGFLEFRRSLNAGAIFGVGAGWVWVFVVASLAALAFVIFLFHGSTRRQHALHVALGLILAGALGNLHDRIFVRADVVSAVAPSGDLYHDIGLIVETLPDGSVHLGSYPEKAQPRYFSAQFMSAPPRRQGVVRDFIKFVPVLPRWVPVIGGHDAWPWVFNIADAMLVAGVGILLLHFWSAREVVVAPHEAQKALSQPGGGDDPADRDSDAYAACAATPDDDDGAVCVGREPAGGRTSGE